MVSKTPLSRPEDYSLFAACEREGDAQVDDSQQFSYQGMTAPNGEQLVAAVG